jgi:hypothetical protein
MKPPNAEPNEGAFRPPATPGRQRAPGRALLTVPAALVLIVLSALAGTRLARLLNKPPGPEPEAERAPPTALGLRLPDRLERAFLAWGPRPPDVVLLLTGQQHGYLLPCGCSQPQTGGLERRYNLLRLLKARGWPVVAVDLGDVARKEGIGGPAPLPNVQGLPKYVTAMQALRAMGYSAVGLGEDDAALANAPARPDAGNEGRPPVLSANLLRGGAAVPGLQPWVEGTEVDAGRPGTLPVKVGITSVVGPAVQQRVRGADIAFGPPGPALRQVLAEMDAAGVELRVLLYQGPAGGDPRGTGGGEGVRYAREFPPFQVLLCLSEAELPPARPGEVGHEGSAARTQVLGVGHKGKHVGVLGVWRTGQADPPWAFKYQAVELTPEFATPGGREEGHPVLSLLEDYTRGLRAGDYLSRYPQARHALQALPPVAGLKNAGDVEEPRFVGSDRCMKCHEHASDVWRKTPHSSAYQALVDARRPSNRPYDGECIVCHTVGFGYRGGFRDAGKTPHLRDVGCESCHGPASLHVKNPANPEWQRRMNLAWAKDPAAPLPPGQERRRLGRIETFCRRCHDADNDVTWTEGAFAAKWAAVAHPTPEPPG